jgi:hypothetical protein
MALPQGVDFRATSGYVTDPTNCTYETLVGSPYVNYPTTTPQGNNIGWETAGFGWLNSRDRSTGVDARLAGILYNTNANTPVYRIDLPATGSHNNGLAIGDMGSSPTTTVVFKDDVTTISTVSGLSAAANFLDATGVSRTAAAWPGSQALLAHTFASTIFRAELGTGSATSGFIAHLYIESAGGGTPTLLPSGISSLEAFGTASISVGPISVLVSGISSSEAFGTHVLSNGSIIIVPSGIASLEAFGTAILDRGTVIVSPNGISTAEAFGTASALVGTLVIYPNGISSAELFGIPAITGGTPSLITSVFYVRGFSAFGSRRNS